MGDLTGKRRRGRRSCTLYGAGTVPHGPVSYTHLVRAAGSSTDIFTEDYIPISCLPEEKVRVTYKKEITLPNMVLGMLQMGDEPADEFAFAF